MTCLVGKNEAGKTAVLRALYRLKPVIEGEGFFDVTDDYPSRSTVDYELDIAAERRKPATVVQATYTLEPDDISAVEKVFGPDVLTHKKPTVTLKRGYANETTFSGLCLNGDAAIRYLIGQADLPQSLIDDLNSLDTVELKVKALQDAEQTEGVSELTPMLQRISENGINDVLYDEVLQVRIPKFLYFDEYYQMKGQDNLDALKQRLDSNTLEASDYPLLGLIDLAGLDLDQLRAPGRTEALLSRLESAENQLTKKVLQYWSQNKHLRMKFAIHSGQSEDPEGMRSGMNIWGRVQDTKHMVSTPLGTRSRGFVWFFSFLAWYSQLGRKGENVILLLDEPGLSLHAKAQADLLRYFEKELKPHHQLIYTTHSPFMVDPSHFCRVRIVQDLSIDSNTDELPEKLEGTKVITEVLDATPDSLFPLQGALGYEISQTLFIGPNCLIVEGVSDLLYIQTISAILQEKDKDGLSQDWTVTPVGGSDKVPTFVALIGARTDLNVAVLIDFQKNDQQSIENLYKGKLLKKKKVLTYADFVENKEADIEDMFDPAFYLKLVNRTFGSCVALADLPENHPRILRRLEEYLQKNPLPKNEIFNHYRPARYFSENIRCLGDELSEQELDRFEKAFKALNTLL